MRLEKAQHSAGADVTRVAGVRARFLVVLVAATMSLTLPAAVLAQRPARAGAQATKSSQVLAGEGESIRPFRVRVPQEALDDLRRRLAATRWPDRETVADRSQGAQPALLRELVQYWGTKYDWRKAEAKLNAFPSLIYFREAERGGHFAACEEPQLFAQGIRAAFRSLR